LLPQLKGREGLLGAEHVFLCRGAKVRVRGDGEIEVLTEPAVRYCPFVEAFYGIRHIDRGAVERIVRLKMEKFGFCRPCRRFDFGLIVPFGSSEIISTCMRKGLLDCAVTVCEGAGTVLAWEPGLVQGIGAIMTGVLETSPMREVVSYVREHGGEPLDSSSARIDQVSGVEKAISMGFKRIAVTVIGPMAEDVVKLRELEAENPGVKIAIFSTCNTLVRPEQAEVLREADVVCASASEHVRAIVGPKAIMQMGVSIPVFVMTELGKTLALSYLTDVRASLVVFRARMPYIVEEKQPVLHKGGHEIQGNA